MCSSTPSPPKVIQRDPVAEAKRAADLAARKANRETAAIRRRQRDQSMDTGAGYETALGGGKASLGD
jgi:vacuolar-type H+-ATPase subunit E/Vma4